MSKILKYIVRMSFRYACYLDMYSSMNIYTFVYVHVVCYSPRLDYFITYSLSLSFDFSPLSSCLTSSERATGLPLIVQYKTQDRRVTCLSRIFSDSCLSFSLSLSLSFSLSLVVYLFVSFSYPLSTCATCEIFCEKLQG